MVLQLKLFLCVHVSADVLLNQGKDSLNIYQNDSVCKEPKHTHYNSSDSTSARSKFNKTFCYLLHAFIFAREFVVCRKKWKTNCPL